MVVSSNKNDKCFNVSKTAVGVRRMDTEYILLLYNMSLNYNIHCDFFHLPSKPRNGFEEVNAVSAVRSMNWREKFIGINGHGKSVVFGRPKKIEFQHFFC